MKRKFLIICLGFFICLGVFFGVNRILPSANATTANVYTIQNSGSSFSVNNGDGSVIISSWKDVISRIEEDASGKSLSDIYLSFINVDLDKTSDEYLLFSNSNFRYNLSGTLKSRTDSAVIRVSPNESVSISVENIDFDCANSDYVVLLNENNSKLYVGGKIEYNTHTDFFTKYINGCVLGVTDEKLISKLNIVLPYNIINKTVMNYKNEYDNTNVNFVPESDYYFVNCNYDSALQSQSFFASCYVYVDFDVNGGEFVSSEYKYNYINYIGTVDFPTNNQVKKFESWICGWFGKVDYNGVTYYFDAKMLEKFSSVDYDFNKISEYFVTDLENSALDNDSSFSMYSYNGEGYQSKEHFNFFVNNRMKLSYIAKWKFYTYNLSFITYSDESIIETKTYRFGEEIVLPDPPILTGYTFIGWFTNASLTNEFSDATMPSKNVELYAKWQINTYKIFFNSNGGSEIEPLTAEYNSVIQEPSTPTKEGSNFKGWYSDEQLTQPFNFEKMPPRNLTLYARWEYRKYDVYFILSGGYFENGLSTIYEAQYGDILNKPINNPIKTGYIFIDWYISDSFIEKFDFSKPIQSITLIYAKWEAINYTISFNMGELPEIDSIMQIYDADISSLKPSDPQKTGYLFIGWQTDDGEDFAFNKMPARNIILVPKWQEKQNLEISFNSQSYNYSIDGSKFVINSEISGFEVYYLVNNEWTRVVPDKVGEYDVMIKRNEDSDYKYFETTIKKGFSILRIKKDMTWLGVIFNILTIFEIALILLIRKMKHMKLSNTYSVALGEIFFISTGQMFYLVISGIVFVAFFVYFIYDLVKLININNNEEFRASKLDNRERFKDDLVFQRNVEIDPNFTYETKTNESFGGKYSEKDIEKMLEHDEYSQNLIKKREEKFENKNSNNVENTSNLLNINNLTQNNENNELANSDDLLIQDNQNSIQNDEFLKNNDESDDDLL